MKRVSLYLGLSAALLSGAAFADPRGDVVAAYQKAMADGSYRMNMTTSGKGEGQNMVLEVQLPDSYHMKNAQTEMIILPAGTWMNLNGKWMKMPVNMSQKMQGYSAEAMKDSINTVQEVTYIGDEDVEGCSSKHYRYATRGEVMGVKADSDVDMWICGATGLPAKMWSKSKSGEITIVYDFDAPINITPPR